MRAFGELEAVIMDVLWHRAEPATVRQVHDQLAGNRPLAYTTVLTVLDNLHRKGFLHRQMSGRRWMYRPAAGRDEHIARVMREALRGAGDPATALAQFVAGLTPQQSQALRAVLRRCDRGAA
jgi:predicted transcriptional regulator